MSERQARGRRRSVARVEAAELLELPRPEPEGLPKLLGEDFAKRAEWLITHPLRFRDLHGTNKLPNWQRRQMTPRRPSRMRAIGRTSIAMARRCDLISSRVGTPRRDSYTTATGETLRHFNGVGQFWIDKDDNEQGLAAEAGLPIISLRRAIGDMLKAGWLTISQRRVEYTNKAGKLAYYACRAVYTLTLKFWQAFDLDKKFTKERAKACERAGNKRRIYALALLTRNVRSAAANADAAENLARRIASLQATLRDRNPGWSSDRVRATARRLARE